MNREIRVLIADDHAILREGLRVLFDTDPSLTIVGEASDGEQAIALALERAPDVLVLDLVLPRGDGLEVIETLRLSLPKLPILMLSSFAERHKVLRALKLGAAGYLLKEAPPHDLLEAVHAVAGGRTVLAPEISQALMEELHEDPGTAAESLTDREQEVLLLIAQGRSNQQIADQLRISERTTRHHVSHILAKLGLENRTQAALHAVRQGLVTL